jgi:GTP-binding protein
VGTVIAIDGPAGAGKSTLARALAQAVDLPYVNTGLMYRAVALLALERGIEPSDPEGLAGLARELRFALGGGRQLTIDGSEPSPELRSPEVEAIVSEVAAHPEVREVLRAEQRSLGSGGSVMEGRDIGSMVFPDADVKIFLSATQRERAGRRERERGGEIARRDALDARTNPLTPGRGAHVIDTTGLTEDAVLARALAIVQDDLGEGAPRRGPVVVAVVGRPNVGKSTLVNRLAGRTQVIVHETSGVTRDRVQVPARWGDRNFVLLDTGGFVPKAVGIDEAVVRQAKIAIRDADLTLLVVDATTGILSEDESLARALRRSPHPVLVVANKVDAEAQESLAAEFYGLGLGEPTPVSALHGRSSGDLLDRLVALIPESSEPRVEDEARFCIVGRPNVGKSSLFNRLVGEERAVVHDLPGTTRDAVDTVVDVGGRPVRFIDTAGLRRPLRTKGIEYYGLIRSIRAIGSSHVAALVVDASEGLVAEDKRVAARVVEAGRGLVAILNKWDLVPSGERADRFVELKHALELFPGTPVLRTSALTGSGVTKVLPAFLRVHEAWTKRVSTSEVNRVLQSALDATPPPRDTGRIRYATQVSAGPPTFVVFGSKEPSASYRRYLEGALRRAFGLEGVPVRISFRAREPRSKEGRRRSGG